MAVELLALGGLIFEKSPTVAQGVFRVSVEDCDVNGF